ncbi:6-phosphogluconate dehydrogenase [Paenibacillus selenitireducens]|uniref:NADH:ubiquinone reductase (non-electrogenic) n=1 Tax=Paenibacillus selenitireducens TaxID=1324314 RepID=A0A1T2XAU7_9BACL|nr:FAD-dependent oxidoreductase [Paenibacillus selenitireducens]OPA76960.1 6-phosphogluconate dehydrogenase [Paenibacillus selenitireducens]
MTKKIVVLGGGYGGVLTAKKLAKKFKKGSGVEIKLIDRKPYHTLLTELHEVAAGRVEEDSIKVDLKKIFAGRNVDVVLDDIANIDFDNNTLHSKGNNKYQYDYLVIGTGCKPSYFGISGAEEHAFSLWSYEDAVKLREHIRNMFIAAVKETNPTIRKQMLTFVVVGAGFTGIEMIGELGEYKEQLCKEFYVEPSEVRLVVADMAPKILPILPDKLIAKAKKRLDKLGIEVITGTQITGVSPTSVSLGESGDIEAKTVIWTAGVEGSDLVGDLDLEQKGRKRIVTNEHLQSVDHKNVYVVGDNIFFIPEGEERPVPQMVENAENAAPVIANNIHAVITGGEQKAYKPVFHGAMVCIGGRYGVANVGLPGKMFMFSGFMAMFFKHFINLFYLFQVCGFNKCYSYMLHEFFHVPNRRSFVGGHLSKRSPNFWLVPLRVFVGAMWLKEGLNKLPKVWKDPTNIFLIPAKAVDGTSAATQAISDVHQTVDASAAASAVEGAKTAVEAIPVPGFISNMVNGTMDMFFYTNDGGYTFLATLFQTAMVAGEIIFGLMLIAGLFTSIASIATIGMGLMIWTSGMAPYEMLWYWFAGCALIGGSGSTLGLDYYLYPHLKRIWKKIPIVRKWYIYAD